MMSPLLRVMSSLSKMMSPLLRVMSSLSKDDVTLTYRRFTLKTLLLFAAATASDYASAQMVSEDTVTKFKQYEQTTPGLNYGMVQSAATSSEFVSRCVVKQKKKSYISN